MRRERSENITPDDNATNEKKLRDIKYKEDIETNNRIYNLVVEEENNVKKKQEFWANLKQIRN